MGCKKDLSLASNKKATKKRKQTTAISSEEFADPGSMNDSVVQSEEDVSLPIIGIGASAGGLEAFEQFFKKMPFDSGMAFVLVQHLDATRESILCDLLRRFTPMEVFQAEDGMAIGPNCVYTIPPNRVMAIMHGRLHLLKSPKPHHLQQPIDYFFQSLAQDVKERSVGVLLSGTGTDGTLGLKSIKEAGGIAIAEDPECAKYDGMPKNAITSGVVDEVLPPGKIASRLIAYVQHVFTQSRPKTSSPRTDASEHLQKVFLLLRSQTGHDFSLYKRNAILRRVERRMAIHQIQEMATYVRFLQENRGEVDKLFKDLLIGVSNFFRDPQAFEALQEKVIPQIYENRPPDRDVRIWIPACSTGEEAYSIAILMLEYIKKLNVDYRIQVFATDIDNDSIEVARMGKYPASIAADVSADRLKQFFTTEDSVYQVKKSLRDMLVFAVQDIAKDPPFSKLDIVSCRNLLIYLEPGLQKKLFSLFHYALNENGYLFLGTSETVGDQVDLFTTIDGKWKVFQRKGIVFSQSAIARIPTVQPTLPIAGKIKEKLPHMPETVSLREMVERDMLQSYTPACVIIDEKCRVLYIHGQVGNYLEPAAGEASLDILKMARRGVKTELTTAIHRVLKEKKEIYREGLRVKTNDGFLVFNLKIESIKNPPSLRGLLKVVFETVFPYRTEKLEETDDSIQDENLRIAELEHELISTREYLQSTIEQLETSNEELRSTNEELQSSNEELQSSGEELETSKEESQSVNEELITVNAELENKMLELSRAKDDLSNLLSSTEIGTVFLDTELKIRLFTPSASKAINLIQIDVGRPLSHIVTNLKYDRLIPDIQDVLDTLVRKEIEAQTHDGIWYLVCIVPYRTAENLIDGVVVTFVDITTSKQLELEAMRNRLFAENIFNTIRESMVVLDGELKVVSANLSFYKILAESPEKCAGKKIFELGGNRWDIPEFQALLRNILPEKTTIENYRIEYEIETVGKRTMLLNARQLKGEAGEKAMILLAIEDATPGE